MAYLGAYYRKYKYPTSNTHGGGISDSSNIEDDIIKPQYKVDGLEPDVADANLLDEEIADIGRKLGAFQSEIDAARTENMYPTQRSRISSVRAVLNDELLGNRVQVVGSDETASTVEPEVRRIFGEYQTAAFLDSLSDSDNSDSDDSDNDDFDNVAGFNGGEDSVEGEENNDVVSMEKSFHGISYYEVDNTKQYNFEPATKPDEDPVDTQLVNNTLIGADIILGADMIVGAEESDSRLHDDNNIQLQQTPHGQIEEPYEGSDEKPDDRLDEKSDDGVFNLDDYLE
jgi:hypothetical protein